jgi:hypothetical protein
MEELLLKKLFIALFVLIFLAVAAGIAGVYYIRPDATLTLQHEKVDLKKKTLDMAKRMSFEIKVSEADVNNVLKKSLAQNPQRSKDVLVQGARFTLEGDRLIADLSLLWKNRVPAGLQVIYRLTWSNPNVIAKVEQVKLKDITLSPGTVEDLVLPIAQDLPKPLKIENVAFGNNELIIKLKKPSMMDLAELLG